MESGSSQMLRLPLLAGFRIEHADRLVGLIQRGRIGWYHAVHARPATVQHEPALVVNPVRKGVQSGPFGPGGLFQANVEGQESVCDLAEKWENPSRKTVVNRQKRMTQRYILVGI